MAESKLEASPGPVTASQSDAPPVGLQVAQAGTAAGPMPIGEITVLEGSARATHSNAEVVELKLGDPVYEGDTVETGPGSSLAITFTDHSVVTLSENARMVIEVLIYDPADNENLLTMTMVQGEFLLFSGDIAGSGKMLANTPVGQLDVTGTGVFTGIGMAGAPTTIVLVTAGLFTLIGSEDSTVFQVLGEAIRLLSASGEHPGKIIMDLQELVANNPALFSAAQLALSLVQQQLESQPDGQGLEESIVPEAGGEDGGQSFPGPPRYPGLDDSLFDPLGSSPPGGDGQPSQDLQGPEPDPSGQSSGPETTTAFRLITLLQTLADLLPGAAPEPGTPAPGTPEPVGGAAAAAAAIFALVDSATTNEDTENTAINLLAGAGSTAGGLSVASVTGGSSGTVAILDASAGLISYSLPAGLFDLLDQGSSATDSFTYTLIDGAGTTVTQTVTVTIQGLNDPPTAAAAAGVLPEDGPPLAIDLAGSIADPDQNAVLTVTADPGSNGGTTSVAGTVVTFTPVAGFYDFLGIGETAQETFGYSVADEQGATASATVTVTIVGENDPPAAVDDKGETDEDTPLVVLAPGVLGNDTDPDTSDSLTVTAVNGLPLVGPTVLPSGATLTMNADGGYVYDPTTSTGLNALKLGESATDRFVYTASDGNGGTATATVSLTLNGRNDVPLVEPDKIVSTPGDLVEVDLRIARPVDPDGDALKVTVIEAPDNGTVTLADGITKVGAKTALNLDQITGLLFTPFVSAIGKESKLTYSVDDGNGGTVTSTITLSVTEPKADLKVAGSPGNDILIGGAGDDALAGADGEDRLSGGIGQDRLTGGPAADALYGDGGDDSLEGEGGNDLLYGDDGVSGGTDGDDLAYGGAGRDTLYGDDGDDVVFGGEDTLYGDAGGDLAGAGAGDALHGEGGEDTVYGDAGGDLLAGASGGADLITGGASEDSLFGDAGGDLRAGASGGNDSLYGGTAEDRIYGDAGGDLLDGAIGGADTLDGGGSPDRLYGDAGGDLIGGATGGGDLIYGVGGDDALYGDAGDDAYGGAGGGDTLYGGERDDKAFGDFGDHQYGGTGGDDTAYGGPGDDTIAGDSGDSNYGGLGGNDTLYGDDGAGSGGNGAGNDTLIGDAGDEMRAGARGGDDTAFGEGGNDRLFGDAFDDLYGGATQGGNDLLYGGDDDDQLYGDAGDDVFGGAQGGSDTLYGDAGADRIYGDNGETMFGGGAGDTLYGGSGGDELYGDAGLTISATSSGGNDLLYGGADDDTLYGDAGARDNGNGGDDTLFGNQGGDTLTGGAGADRFIFSENDGNRGNPLLSADLITDFTPGIDSIGLQGLLPGQVVIADAAGSATVTVVGSGEILAVLDGVQTSDLQAGDVVFL